MKGLAGTLSFLSLLAWAGPARADDESLAETLRGGLAPHALVLEVSMGMAGTTAQDGPQVLSTESGAPLGVMAAFTAGIRTVFFVTPAIDVGYAGLGGSTQRVRLPSGDEARVDNRMEMVFMTFGLLVDLWRFRLRGGSGVVNIGLDSRTGGAEAHTSRWDFGYVFGVTGYLYRSDEGRQLGLEGRVTVDTGNDIVVLTLALVGTLDWPGFGLGESE